MAIGSGIASQIGMKPEVTWGTYIAPDRFFEFNEAESLKANWASLDTQGFGDVYLRSGRNRVWVAGASGTVPMPFMTQGCGILLKHMLGAAAAPTGTGPYTHVFTSSVAGLNTLSMTVQKGVPDTGGTVRPFSFVGGVVTEWNIICEIDQNVRLSTVWDFKSATTAEALATASYPADNTPFSFIDGTCEVDDVAVSISRCRLHGMNRFNVNRRSFGNTKRRQIPNGAIGIDGEIRMEFESLDEYNKFIAGTESKLELLFAYGTNELNIEIPIIQYTGDTPTVESQDIVPLTLPFRVLYGGSGSPITATLINDDATP